MARKFIKLPSMANVQKGSTAVLNCPVGLTYDQIDFEYAGVTLAQIKNIEVQVNGKTIQKFKDAQRLQDINTYYGRNIKSGAFTLLFIRPEMHSLAERRLTALGTADVQTLSIKMDIDSAATAPELTAHAVQSNAQPLGVIVKVKTFPVTFATAGQQDIDNIPRAGRIAAVHLFKDDVSHAEVELNSVKVYDRSKQLGEGTQKDYKRAPVTAKATHLDFGLEGELGQHLVMAGLNDFRIRPTIGTPGAIDVTVEYIDGFAGI